MHCSAYVLCARGEVGSDGTLRVNAVAAPTWHTIADTLSLIALQPRVARLHASADEDGLGEALDNFLRQMPEYDMVVGAMSNPPVSESIIELAKHTAKETLAWRQWVIYFCCVT